MTNTIKKDTDWIIALYQETEQTSEQRMIALSFFCAEVDAWLKRSA